MIKQRSASGYRFPILRYVIGVSIIGFLSLGTSAVVSAATTATTISSLISPVISLSSDGTVNVDVVPTGSGAQTIASDTVTVNTSDTNGYTLQLSETSGSSSLVSGSNTIPNSSGTQASPTAMTNNTWGYRVDSVGGFGAGPTTAQSSIALSSLKFSAVPATGSPDILTTTSGTAMNATTTVWYSVAANTSQPEGTYTNSVTYTATGN
jgi:hypothetical protein